MSIWIALIIGLILGWLIEWLIDWVFWRRGVDEFYATETELRAQLAEAHNTIDDLRRQLTATSRAASASPAHTPALSSATSAVASKPIGRAAATNQSALPRQENARG